MHNKCIELTSEVSVLNPIFKMSNETIGFKPLVTEDDFNSANQPVPQVNFNQGPSIPLAYVPNANYPDKPVGYVPVPVGVPPPDYPVTVQPQPHVSGNLHWMPTPVGIPNCPPGLEYLTAIDQILVHQQVEILELLTGFETENKYLLKNNQGQHVYMAAESSGCCQRLCCGNIREFDMKIMDNYQNHLIHLYRPLACQSCCFPCCLQTLEISSPPGTLIGTVEQRWSIIKPYFDIKDITGNVVLKIVGPICKASICCNDVVFKIYDPDGETLVGNITKQWSGCLKEHFTDADNFSVTFPMDLDVKVKAILIGACFLIDFMYFEDKQNNNNASDSVDVLFSCLKICI